MVNELLSFIDEVYREPYFLFGNNCIRKSLKIKARAEELGMPNLPDMIADETVGVTEEEILPFLQEKGHPALTMDPIIG